jgi:hypothetical protein
MTRWLILLFVLATSSGCGHLEDMMFGPDPYSAPEQSWGNPSTCSQSPPPATIVQTQEPPR